MAKRIAAAFTISAPLERVWPALANLSGYSSWNPFITKAEGQLQPKATAELVYELDVEVPMAVTVQAVQQNHKIIWRYASSIPGILSFTHTIIIAPKGAADTDVHQEVSVGGLMSGAYMKRAGSMLESGLRAMNEALAIEAGASHVPLDDSISEEEIAASAGMH